MLPTSPRNSLMKSCSLLFCKYVLKGCGNFNSFKASSFSDSLFEKKVLLPIKKREISRIIASKNELNILAVVMNPRFVNAFLNDLFGNLILNNVEDDFGHHLHDLFFGFFEDCCFA